MLMVGVVVPGATQGSFSRQALVNALNAAIGPMLIAGTGELLNPEDAAFFSFKRATSAYIPPHTSAFSAQLFRDYMLGKAEGIFLGAVYVSEDVPGSLNKGFYRIKALNREWIVVLNQEGEVVRKSRIRWFVDDVEEIASNPSYWGKDSYISISVASREVGYHYNGGTGGTPPGGTPPPQPPPPPPPPPQPQPICINQSISICVGPQYVQLCFTFAEWHI